MMVGHTSAADSSASADCTVSGVPIPVPAMIVPCAACMHDAQLSNCHCVPRTAPELHMHAPAELWLKAECLRSATSAQNAAGVCGDAAATVVRLWGL